MAPINKIDNNSLAAVALRIAQDQVGQTEKPVGSNSGPMVDEYLRAVGLKPGYAWCQAFVYWCYNEAAKQLGVKNPVARTASVHECWNRSADIRTPKDAAADIKAVSSGDQFVMLFGGGSGHTGMVERISWVDAVDHAKGIVLHTIEGNSNNNGSREGYEVVRHQRMVDEQALKGFIKYS